MIVWLRDRHKWYTARFIAGDSRRDLAVLGFRLRGDVKCINVSATPAPSGARAQLSGYRGGGNMPQKGSWRDVTLTSGVVQFQNAPGVSVQRINAQVWLGESGGPLVTSNGLVGVLTNGNQSGIAVTTRSIRSFLRETFGNNLPVCGGREILAPPPPPIDNDLDRDKDRRSAITDLRKRIVSLENRQWKTGVKGDPGAKGETGSQGPPGRDGADRTVTVIFQDAEGNQLARPVHVPPGKNVVRVPIDRIQLKQN